MAGEQHSIGFLDYSLENSSSSVHVGGVTAVSLPGLLTQIAAYVTAVDNITIGTLRDDTLIAFSTNRSSTPPASPLARRESKWLIRYEDNLPFFDDPVNAIPNAGFGKIFTFTIPTADFLLTGAFPLNSDDAVLTQTQLAAFVTAFEAMARSPYGGTVNVLGIEAVGRNL